MKPRKAKYIKVIKVPIELDKPRTLAFDLNAFAELEDIYGSVEAAMEALQKGSIKAIRNILWVGFLHNTDDSLDILEVGALIGPQSLEYIAEVLNEALSESLADENPPEGDIKDPLSQ